MNSRVRLVHGYYLKNKNNVVILLFVLMVLLYYANTGEWITPDILFLCLLVVVVVLGRIAPFLVDWLPFVFLLFGYQILRGAFPDVVGRTNTYELIYIEERLFGTILPLLFQRLFYASTLRWYDYLSTFVYVLHFVTPLLFAFIIWLKARRDYWLFVLGLLLLSYAGFVTYYIFPATPPWLASYWGVIPKIELVQEQVFQTMHIRSLFSLPQGVRLFSIAGANPVAAMPSLHAAYPYLMLLYGTYFSGKKGLLLVPYVLMVFFAVIYTGEHYAIDVVLGIVYASGAFLVVVGAARIIEHARKLHTIKMVTGEDSGLSSDESEIR